MVAKQQKSEQQVISTTEVVPSIDPSVELALKGKSRQQESPPTPATSPRIQKPPRKRSARDAVPADSQEVDVRVSTTNQRDAYEHDLQLRDTQIRRLQKLQLKVARLGDSADPSIEMEIEDIERKLLKLDAKIARYLADIATRSDRENLLAIQQQRAIVLAITRLTGLPSDKIKLVDIVVGSIVLIIDMPLTGAARLVAMQRLNHPMLRAQGFANVALDRVVDMQGQPLDSMFDRAVRFEEAELNAATLPSTEASPYAGINAEARLRITLTEDAVRQE